MAQKRRAIVIKCCGHIRCNNEFERNASNSAENKTAVVSYCFFLSRKLVIKFFRASQQQQHYCIKTKIVPGNLQNHLVL
jgi:hypothetical protein